MDVLWLTFYISNETVQRRNGRLSEYFESWGNLAPQMDDALKKLLNCHQSPSFIAPAGPWPEIENFLRRFIVVERQCGRFHCGRNDPLLFGSDFH
jgi:hypothetical protein